MTAPAQAVASSTPTPPSIGHQKVLVVFSGLLLVMLLAALDSTIVATALPTIVGEIGGLNHLAWVVTAYLLAQTVVTPLYGKLGDLYGRKIVLQVGIVVFLIGSALCGISHSMTQLILFRAVQGLGGGGGLMVTTQAVVGDIVTPRERGRYQGIFGAVFGVSSVAGPLIGGYFTTHLTWRWIFYINVPIGLIALVVLAVTLPRRPERVSHAIDYTGAALLAIALSAITLVSDLGGTAYEWTSPMMLGLIAISLLGLVLFIVAERRAKEPVLPLRLFANRAFTVTSAVGLIVGFALFGSVTYLPVFLQIVQGASPTASGLEMIPMMGGVLVTSIASGQLISKTGRYKVYPIMGTGIMTVGLFLLSRMTAGTSILGASLMMLLLGLGLGMVMQVLVIAVQNSVDYADLGVATSGATLFRLIGGSLGTAVLGAVFAARLAGNLEHALAGVPGAAMPMGASMNPTALAKLPPQIHAVYAAAFTTSLNTVFLIAAVIAVCGFALTWLLPEEKLRESIAASAGDAGRDAGDAFPMPHARNSDAQLVRGLATLADRDVQRKYIEQIVSRAGLDLIPAAAWLLVSIEREPTADPLALGRRQRVDPGVIRSALDQLHTRGLISEPAPTAPGAPRDVTAAGCDVLERLAVARRDRLEELFSEWPNHTREEIAAVLQRIARELVPEPRRSAITA